MGAAEATVGRWRPRLLGAAVGMAVYALFAVVDFVGSLDRKDCEANALGPLAAYCAPGWIYFALVVYGTPVMAIVVGVLALSRRTRTFAGGLGIGVIGGVPAGFGLLVGLVD